MNLWQKRKQGRQDVTGRVFLGTGYSLSTDHHLATGSARNLSATGLSFETDEALHVGSRIDITIDLEPAGEITAMRCSGTVIRRDELEDGHIAFAMKIDEQRIGH